MKKPYIKPQVHYESFMLTEHIAGPCDSAKQGDATYRDGDSCTFTVSEMTIFSDVNSACVEGMQNITYDTLTFPTLNDFLLNSDCYNAFADLGASSFAS